MQSYLHTMLNNNFKINMEYIAGFFDGEGNVAIKVSVDKRRKFQVYFGGRIQIIQTNKEILCKIKNFLNCGYVKERKIKNLTHLKSYSYVIQKEEELRYFIDCIKEICYRKHQQLVNLQEFLDERKKRKTGLFYSKDDALKFIEFAEKMQLLNDRKRIAKTLIQTKQKIIDFNEDEYLERMQKSIEGRVENLTNYSKENFRIEIKEEDLRKFYLEEKLSCPKIAKKYRCHKTTINRRLVEYGIKKRTPSEELELLRGRKNAKK